MKKQNVVVILIIAMISVSVNAQKKQKYTLNANEVPKVTHVHLIMI